MIDWSTCPAVERDQSRVSGAWVFRGTRVPVTALLENLEDGAPITDFVSWVPGVTTEQVRIALEHAAVYNSAERLSGRSEMHLQPTQQWLLPALAAALLVAQPAIADAPPAATPACTADDRLDILQLSSRYAWGIDSGVDRQMLASVFAEDAVADYVGVGENPFKLNEHLVGFEAIYAWLYKSLGHRKGTDAIPVHFNTNPLVECHGDSADLRFFMHSRAMAAGGVYRVNAVRTKAGWRIARLRLEEQTWNAEHFRNDPVARKLRESGK